MLKLLRFITLLFLLPGCDLSSQRQQSGEDLARNMAKPSPSSRRLGYEQLKKDSWQIFDKHQSDNSFVLDTCPLQDEYSRQIIQVGNLFSPGQKSALLMYSTSDSTAAVTVMHYRDQQWVKALEYPSFSFYHPLPDSVVRISDVNGDGAKDLAILYNMPVSATAWIDWQLWLNEAEANQFIYIPEYSSIHSPEHQGREIYSYQSTCAASAMFFLCINGIKNVLC